MNEQSARGAVPAASEQYVLTLSCPDKMGIVHAVSSYLFMTGCNIEDSQQFGDHDTGLFFMRVHFSAEPPVTLDKLRASFAAIGDSFQMGWQLNRAEDRMRVIVECRDSSSCTIRLSTEFGLNQYRQVEAIRMTINQLRGGYQCQVVPQPAAPAANPASTPSSRPTRMNPRPPF